MNKYLEVWKKTASCTIQSNLQQRGGALLFMLGKIIRFIFFLIFLLIIGDRVTKVSDYTLDQMITFFLFFNLFDIFGQTFFRGIYWFREQVVSGEFDFRLVKPMNSLFQVLTRQTDVLDIPILFIVIISLFFKSLSLSLDTIFFTILLVISGLLIVTAIHIFVAGLGVITTEVDHTIMIYRDLSSMARVPVDIYSPSIRAFLTFVIPIGIAYTLPAKVFMELISIDFVISSLMISTLFTILSIIFWNYALTQYSSASS
jgi:ABC-2 type transport system permease protein